MEEIDEALAEVSENLFLPLCFCVFGDLTFHLNATHLVGAILSAFTLRFFGVLPHYLYVFVCNV